MQQPWIEAIQTFKLELQEAEELVESSALMNEENEKQALAVERQLGSEFICEHEGLGLIYDFIGDLPSKYAMSNNGRLEFELRERVHELSDLEDLTVTVLELLWDQGYGV